MQQMQIEEKMWQPAWLLFDDILHTGRFTRRYAAVFFPDHGTVTSSRSHCFLKAP
jgi:hypothetical protein